MRFDWARENIVDPIFERELDSKGTLHGIRDVWAGRSRGDTDSALAVRLPAHDVIMLRLDRKTRERVPKEPEEKR